ncbi:hypothetical protein ACFL0V_00650 [Nanoarchaeota archaeon]
MMRDVVMIIIVMMLLVVPVYAAPKNKTHLNDTISVEGNETLEITLVDDGADLPENSENETVVVEDDLVEEGPEESGLEELEESEPVEQSVGLIDVRPGNVLVGDVLMKVTLQNTGNVALEDISLVIVGTGFTSHDVAPIAVLEPEEEAEVLVAGHFSKAGDVLLTIKWEDMRFYETIEVVSPTRAEVQATKEAEEKELEVLQVEVEALIDLYDALGEAVYEKHESHDLSQVQLDDLRRYIFNAETALNSKESDQANISLMMAKREYQDQKGKLDKAPELSFATKIKTNAQVIGAILGTIIALITLFGMFGRPMLDRMKAKAKSGKKKR